MNPALAQLAHSLENAHTPEEVFGNSHLPRDERAAAVRVAYHRLARIAHPDGYRTAEEQDLAHKTFQKLTEWLAAAETLIAAEAYGNPGHAAHKVVLKTRRREYLVDVAYVLDGIYNAYTCQYRRFGRRCTATLKVVRDPHDNDLAGNEARALQSLRRGWLARTYAAYFPHLLETFAYAEGGTARQALVLETEPGWYSLEEVRAAYPSGVDPKDMAWIWRRLLVALGFAHLSSVLHRAVLPENIWIHPELHGLQLRGWSQSLHLRVDAAAPLGRLAPGCESWYPDEDRTDPSTRTDIVLAAKSMLYLLGGDPQTKTMPETVPQPIAAFLLGSMLPGKGTPSNAWALKEEFDELLEALWGERAYHPFTMPTQFKPKEVHYG